MTNKQKLVINELHKLKDLGMDFLVKQIPGSYSYEIEDQNGIDGPSKIFLKAKKLTQKGGIDTILKTLRGIKRLDIRQKKDGSGPKRIRGRGPGSKRNPNWINEDEIREHIKDRVEEGLDYDKDYLKQDMTDIHHELFNQDYYIIGTWKAKQWLGEDVFQAIETIKEYEQDNFGEVTTDFSNPEAIVNMYTYIAGEQLLGEMYPDLYENPKRRFKKKPRIQKPKLVKGKKKR